MSSVCSCTGLTELQKTKHGQCYASFHTKKRLDDAQFLGFVLGLHYCGHLHLSLLTQSVLVFVNNDLKAHFFHRKQLAGGIKKKIKMVWRTAGFLQTFQSKNSPFHKVSGPFICFGIQRPDLKNDLPVPFKCTACASFSSKVQKSERCHLAIMIYA